MAVQYNSKDNSWSGLGVEIFDAVKNKILGIEQELPELSGKVKGVLDCLNDDSLKSLSKDEIKEFFDDDDILKNIDESKESFMSFLDDVDLSGDVFEQYQAHLQKSSEKMTLFQRASKAASSAAKSFVAALSSMAVTWLIVFLKFQVAWQSRIISKGQFDLLIFYSLLVHIYIVLHTQLQLFFAFYHHFY